MSFIQVKNISSSLHEAVRRRAASEGLTVSNYVLDLIQRDLALPSRGQWLARLEERQAVDVNPIAALDHARAQRDEDLSRV